MSVIRRVAEEVGVAGGSAWPEQWRNTECRGIEKLMMSRL